MDPYLHHLVGEELIDSVASDALKDIDSAAAIRCGTCSTSLSMYRVQKTILSAAMKPRCPSCKCIWTEPWLDRVLPKRFMKGPYNAAQTAQVRKAHYRKLARANFVIDKAIYARIRSHKKDIIAVRLNHLILALRRMDTRVHTKSLKYYTLIDLPGNELADLKRLLVRRTDVADVADDIVESNFSTPKDRPLNIVWNKTVTVDDVDHTEAPTPTVWSIDHCMLNPMFTFKCSTQACRAYVSYGGTQCMGCKCRVPCCETTDVIAYKNGEWTFTESGSGDGAFVDRTRHSFVTCSVCDRLNLFIVQEHGYNCMYCGTHIDGCGQSMDSDIQPYNSIKGDNLVALYAAQTVTPMPFRGDDEDTPLQQTLYYIGFTNWTSRLSGQHTVADDTTRYNAERAWFYTPEIVTDRSKVKSNVYYRFLTGKIPASEFEVRCRNDHRNHLRSSYARYIRHARTHALTNINQLLLLEYSRRSSAWWIRESEQDPLPGETISDYYVRISYQFIVEDMAYSSRLDARYRVNSRFVHMNILSLIGRDRVATDQSVNAFNEMYVSHTRPSYN